ncbi:MAG TPA: HNH endonuclease signature motif containing protein [Pseudoxanthomonas sp.]
MNNFRNLAGCKPAPVEQRFDACMIPVTESGCWLWLASVNGKGYGQIKVGDRQVGAHRYSWERHRGTIPAGMVVCHKCDTPSCVNPDHMFIGEHADNQFDKVAKDRQAKGEGNGQARLSEDAVRAILTSTESHAALARHYGVGASTIKRVRNGETWRYLQ